MLPVQAQGSEPRQHGSMNSVPRRHVVSSLGSVCQYAYDMSN